jgi:hypothetical protein
MPDSPRAWVVGRRDFRPYHQVTCHPVRVNEMKWFRRRSAIVHHWTFPFVRRPAASEDDLRVVGELRKLIAERESQRDKPGAEDTPAGGHRGDDPE